MDKVEKPSRRKISKSTASSDTAANEPPSRLSGLIFFLLCAIPVFSTIAFGANDPWALGLLAVFTGLIVIFWTTDAFLKKEFRIKLNPLQIPFLGLIVIGLIQLLPLRSADIPADLLSVSAISSLSLDPYQTRLAVVQLVIYFIFFAAAFTFLSSRRRLLKTVLTIIIFGSLMAFFGILQRLANPESIYGFRAAGQAIPFASFINQHHFAAFMELTIGLTLAVFFGKSAGKDKRFLLIIAAVVMGSAVIFTGSRGGLLSLIGVIGFVIVSNLLFKRNDEDSSAVGGENNHRRIFALLIGGLTLLLGLFGAVILLGGDASLMRGIGLQAGQPDISSGRGHFWQAALKIFLDHPILGTGLNSFGAAYTRYDSWNGTYRLEQAHNDYLQILSDAGIFGFVCAAAFIYFLFKQSLQIIGKTTDSFRRDTAVGALAGCFGILIHSFFDFPLRTTSNAFFFLLLIVLATVSIRHSKPHRRKE